MNNERITLGLSDLTILDGAISDALRYLQHNSCGDPECCPEPDRSEFEAAVKPLESYGLAVDEDLAGGEFLALRQ